LKKFFLHIVYFISFAAFFYFVVLIAWGNLAPNSWKKNLNYRRGASGFAYTRFNEAKTTGKVDLLFAGSSHAYRGFDPRIFKEQGLSSFNLGSSSQTPLQTTVLLNRYLERLSPAVVVYEVYPYTFSSDGVESSLDVIANDEIDKGSFKMALETNNIKTYNTIIYGWASRLLHKEQPLTEEITSTQKNKNIRSNIAYIPGGFMEYRMEHAEGNMSPAGFDIIHPAVEKNMRTDAGIVQTKEGKWAPKPSQIRAFEKALELLKSKNIRVILVQTPVHSRYYQLVQCNDEIDAYLRSKGEYYNFNTMMSFNDSLDFADYHHLNQTGVVKMNNALIQTAFSKK